MDLNNEKSLFSIKYNIFFKNPIDIYDNLIIGSKCISVQKDFIQSDVPELYQTYQRILNDRLKYLINENGFGLEGISLSNWINNINIIEDKKISRLIFSMNKFRTQLNSKNRKTACLWSIEFKKNFCRIITISFKRLSNWKKNKLNKETFFDFLDNYYVINNKLETNPFSRSFSVKFKTKIFKRDKYTCKYCGWKNGINGIEDRILTLDHIIPIAHGGTSKEENIVTCCLNCNIKKNDRIIEYLFEKVIKDKQIQLMDKGEICINV